MIEMTTQERYNALAAIRQPYLDRAEKYSKVTLRYVMPENRDSNSTTQEEFQLDFSSVGADNVNHLANIYMLTMFPPNRSFFKLTLSDTVNVKDLGITDTELETLLTGAEREARWVFETKHGRPAMLDLFKHLIITGNALLYYPDEDNIQMYPLDQYVVSRSLDGTVTEIITKDTKSLFALPSELRDKVMSTLDIPADQDLHKVTVNLYTHVEPAEDDKYFMVHQSVENFSIDEPFKMLKTKSRWAPQVWNTTRREPYGRGLVEDHYGTLYSINVLEEAMTTGAASMSDIKHLVEPGSVLDVVNMNKSAPGTYHYGSKNDVNTIDKGDSRVLEVISNIVARKEKLIGKAFLSLSSQIRDSERTTAEENRMRAQELEKAHGGIFSTLALLLQKPLATLLLDDLNVSLAGSGIEPVIVSGLDAMGRVSDNEKMLQLFNDLAVMANLPPQILQIIKFIPTVTSLANGRDVDVSKIIMSEKELQAQQQAQAEAQAEQQAQESMLKQASPEQLAEGMQAGQQQ